MSLAKKFTIVVISSILFIAITNILGFYVFYSSYLKAFLAEKIESKSEISIDYINSLVEKQTVDEIDDIFSDTEIELFELLENNDGNIPLTSKANVDVVIDYLLKSGVAPKYIEEVVPTNNFEKVLDALKDKQSPEYKFIKNIFISIVITNLLSIAIVGIMILLFAQKTILPIRQVTKQIRDLKPGKRSMLIDYKAKDEVGLLINSINGLNKRLALQENIRNRLLADISHELKTPITSIQCYLEGISDGIIKLDEKNLGSITSEMERLIDLVNKIMKYEKFENNELDISVYYNNVADILKQVAETHKKKLKEHKQRIKISGDENLEIKLDPDLFKQLTHNLIGNFFKYAGAHTTLTINITKKYIDFCDDGKGIKRNHIPFLTEKFYQADSSKAGEVEERGIGVGLSIVGKIIDAHNWSFKINSDTNKGFSFKIFL